MGYSMKIAALITASVYAHEFHGAESPEYNIKAFNDLFTKLPAVRGRGEAYALYDWDNTCIYGDISETSIYYQVSNLNFRIQPADFEKVFSLGYTADIKDPCFPKGIHTVVTTGVNNKTTTLGELIKSTAEDYTNLFQAYIAPTYKLPVGPTPAPSPTHPACGGDQTLPGNMTLAQIQQTTVFNNFAAKMGLLAFTLENYGYADDFEECAIRDGMTALPQLLVGMKKEEIRSFIRSSIRYNLKSAIGTKTFTSTEDKSITVDYPTGLRTFNGQEATMRAMRSQNVSVYVVSASPQEFVDVASTHSGLTYSVAPENSFGVRFQYTSDGKFTGQLVDQKTYPISWGAGKQWIAENIISKRHGGTAPVFASGDANGDCAMMSITRDGVVLVNNRLKANTNCIQKFYEKACQYYGTSEPDTKNVYLMQGQDKEMGSWINSGYTTKNGIDYSSGTTTSCSSYQTFF